MSRAGAERTAEREDDQNDDDNVMNSHCRDSIRRIAAASQVWGPRKSLHTQDLQGFSNLRIFLGKTAIFFWDVRKLLIRWDLRDGSYLPSSYGGSTKSRGMSA